MTIYNGIRIAQYCIAGSATPWTAEIDLGHVHVHMGKAVTKTTITAATLAALNTAIKVVTDAAGVT